MPTVEPAWDLYRSAAGPVPWRRRTVCPRSQNRSVSQRQANNREKSRRLVRTPFGRLPPDLVPAERCPEETRAVGLLETAFPSADRLLLLRRFAAGPNRLLREDSRTARSAVFL